MKFSILNSIKHLAAKQLKPAFRQIGAAKKNNDSIFSASQIYFSTMLTNYTYLKLN